ncbi:ribosomal protein L22e [Phakopsora pachyrhizi]|nr:ribosomal protein L22e [Phakopsora pachyrhizi]
MSPNTKLASGSAPSKPLKFYIDYSKPASDGVFDGPAFVKFLHDRIKVEGRAGQLGDKIKIEPDGGNKVAVTSTIPFSKRYLKYLTKKVTASNKSTFELRYFLVDQEGDDDES